MFGGATTDVTGAGDLGHFPAATADVGLLLAQGARRYAALTIVGGDLAGLATAGSTRDRWLALQLRDALVARLGDG